MWRLAVVCWRLTRGSRRSGWGAVNILGHDTLSAMRASVVFFEPSAYAVTMEPMTAGKNGNFVADVDVVHAHGTFSLAITAHHALIGFLFRQSANSFSGCRARSGGAMGLLHELCNDAVKGLFGVDSISVSRMVGIEKLGKEVDGRNAGIDGLSVLPHLIHAVDTLE